MVIIELFSTFWNLFQRNLSTFLVGLVVFLLWKFYNSIFFPFYTRKLPPGPTLIPLVGFLPGLVNLSAQWWAEQSLKYKSKIISMRFFGGAGIVLNDYYLIKEHFVKSSLADRQDISFTTVCDPTYTGLIATSGRVWKAHRRFTLHMMKDLGMGKLKAEENICAESRKAINAFYNQAKDGVPFDPLRIINMAVANIINSIVFGKQFDYDDPNYTNALASMNEWFREITDPRNMLMYFPVARFFMKKLMTKIMGLYAEFSAFVMNEIEDHEKKFDGEIKDLIDAYLTEMTTNEEMKGVFNAHELRCLIMDLFLAGSETSYSSLRWFLIYMAAYPDIQEKVYQELNQVMGDRDPTMQDKRNTPYTEAVMSEIQRFNPLIPMTLSHTNLSEDYDIEGYHLPPNAPIFGNIYQVHRDPRFWKNPDQFDVNNFLDEEGNYQGSEKLITFSVGRRSCAGEALAKMELYLFFTSWVKEFKMETETDDTKPDLSFNQEGLNYPRPYKLRMYARKTSD